MKLVKMNESVNRSFSGKTATEEVTSVGYDITENDSVVGSANISQGGYLAVNVQMAGTMDEIKAKVESLFANKE